MLQIKSVLTASILAILAGGVAVAQTPPARVAPTAPVNAATVSPAQQAAFNAALSAAIGNVVGGVRLPPPPTLAPVPPITTPFPFSREVPVRSWWGGVLFYRTIRPPESQIRQYQAEVNLARFVSEQNLALTNAYNQQITVILAGRIQTAFQNVVAQSGLSPQQTAVALNAAVNSSAVVALVAPFANNPSLANVITSQARMLAPSIAAAVLASNNVSATPPTGSTQPITPDQSQTQPTTTPPTGTLPSSPQSPAGPPPNTGGGATGGGGGSTYRPG